MGLLQARDWTGHWIAGPSLRDPDGQTFPVLRKKFRLDRAVRRATLYVASLGYHRIEVNGRRVGDHEFDPVQSDYRRRVYYVTHDVTSCLVAGENVIGVNIFQQFDILKESVLMAAGVYIYRGTRFPLRHSGGTQDLSLISF